MSQRGPVLDAKHTLIPDGVSLKECCEERMVDIELAIELAWAPCVQYAVGCIGMLDIEAVAGMHAHRATHRAAAGAYHMRAQGMQRKGRCKSRKGRQRC